MRKYIPHVASTDLTTSMEEQLEYIVLRKAKSSLVIDHRRLREAIGPYLRLAIFVKQKIFTGIVH